ncbi:hypothetical protein B0A48_12726 [Cryoendolithus antarcticus]|uniref:VanZ-like domain-containing protein n=1 Tax=Cryoendolithus antarcticus TaxID=1507870 RepID=A0A1V8SRJ5_9PEZI|nr:hypothetical protein B0A48_12726 [Cryoendolithus antarcticus]
MPPSIQVRKPFAGKITYKDALKLPPSLSHIQTKNYFPAAFTLLSLASAYLGLSTQKLPQYGQSDKGLHFLTFFLLTLTFYWILETSRRRLINLTLLVCTAGLSIGSEIIQALLPNGRLFDPYDILANVLGSGAALWLCAWYHRRMLERKRRGKGYGVVSAEEGEEGEVDVELGEVGEGQQETGVVREEEVQAGAGAKRTVTEELDRWDENADDEWDETEVEEGTGKAGDGKLDDPGEGKKRAD